MGVKVYRRYNDTSVGRLYALEGIIYPQEKLVKNKEGKFMAVVHPVPVGQNPNDLILAGEFEKEREVAV